MSNRRPTSFWRYTLNLELLTASLVFLLLLMTGLLTIRALEKRYIELFRADAEKMSLYLREHLAESIVQLDQLAALRPDSSTANLQRQLSPFSDLYLIDANQRVQQVLKASADSRVFRGFSFSNSKISSYLKNSGAAPGAEGSSQAKPLSTSVITRGLEDELASIYVQRPLPPGATTSSSDANLTLLARLNLRYIQSFLTQFSRFSGTPVLLVSDDGFVMLSGVDQAIPSIDLNFASATGGSLHPIRLKGKEWLPVVAADSGLGARIVTLVPLQLLREQQQAVVWAAAAASALVALILVVKSLRVRQGLFRPVGQFVEQLRHMESSFRTPSLSRQPLTTMAPLAANPTGEDFLEVQQLRGSFDALMAVIQRRDEILQQQLRTSLTAATIAHEINIPLGTLLLLCEQARFQMASAAGELDTADLVNTLHHQTQDLALVVERMRMLLRNVKTTLAPIRLSDAATSACTYVRNLLEEHQVSLACRSLQSDDTVVLGDASQLKTAITNLLRNAVEAVAPQPTGQRQIAMAIQHHPQSADKAEEVELVIADSGPGFSFLPSDDTLFQSTKPGGSGLGLFVVRTAMANHDGTVEVGRSAELGGAKVSLHFPVAALAL